MFIKLLSFIERYMSRPKWRKNFRRPLARPPNGTITHVVCILRAIPLLRNNAPRSPPTHCPPPPNPYNVPYDPRTISRTIPRTISSAISYTYPYERTIISARPARTGGPQIPTNTLPVLVNGEGVLGLALTRVADGKRVLSARASAGRFWAPDRWTTAQLAPFVGQKFQIEVPEVPDPFFLCVLSLGCLFMTQL